jgi:hypothetical protein
MSADTGGPAFPHIDSGCGRFEEGMTLRDYFAAKAMQTILLSFANHTEGFEVVANKAYAMADLMLKARGS